jgi:uncharacterized protein
MPAIKPSFRDLDQPEMERMLRSHSIGRLAFGFRGQVDIEPLHYVFEDGWLYGRTAPGTKLTVLEHHPWVAFEIDNVTGPFDWQSVVVKGTVYFVERNHLKEHNERYEHIVDVLRRLMPGAFTDDDPVPFRTTLFGIHIDELYGRAASTA